MKQMVLALESSCDDCGAAVVSLEGGRARVLSNAAFSQVELHRRFGGIVPEVASRNHLDQILPVIDQAINEAGISLDQVSAIAATQRPGLIGALLVGVSIGKSIAYAIDRPFIGVDHLSGHLHSLFIQGQGDLDGLNDSHFPMVVCLASGGHTNIYLLRGLPPLPLNEVLLGSSRDDAAGEAFDKCAKLMGLPYPGGAVIDELAKKGNPEFIAFPRPLPGKKVEFSFSGIKTAMANELVKRGHKPHIFGEVVPENVPHGKELADFSASIQEAIVDCLVRKIALAVKQNGAKSIAVVGGVSANSRLRSAIQQEIHTPAFFPLPQYCTDNGAMIGAAAVFQLARGEVLTGGALLRASAHASAFSGSHALGPS